MKNDKKQRLVQIKEMLRHFCDRFLTDEYADYALKLCDALGRKRTIDITRGRKEIWGASIIHVIARLNFLFDKSNENYITADTICDYFQTKKSTVGNKATQIAKACDLTFGAEDYCREEITDLFTFYQTPEGFIIPKSMVRDGEVLIDCVAGEDAEELERLVEEQRRTRKQRQRERKKKPDKKKGDSNQLDLFNNS